MQVPLGSAADLWLAGRVLIAFYKPYDVLSQFTVEVPGQRTLAEFDFPPGFYGIGRLDRDSEGLLLLSDEAHWTHKLLDPRRGHPRSYWVQVEGVASAAQMQSLAGGVSIRPDKKKPPIRTQPCEARLLPAEVEQQLPARVPPIRQRAAIPTSWIELTLREGKNRQVRRMTAALGLPTLRLVRVAIGALHLRDLNLSPGRWILLDESRESLF